MKKTVLFTALLCTLLIHSQQPDAAGKPNPFAEAEKQDTHTALGGPALATGTGPPGDEDLPIDGPLPLLGIAAVAIIVYTVYRRKNITV